MMSTAPCTDEEAGGFRSHQSIRTRSLPGPAPADPWNVQGSQQQQAARIRPCSYHRSPGHDQLVRATPALAYTHTLTSTLAPTPWLIHTLNPDVLLPRPLSSPVPVTYSLSHILPLSCPRLQLQQNCSCIDAAVAKVCIRANMFTKVCICAP